MSIQGSINQGITVASVLASQSPSYKDAVEKRINAREIEKGEAKYQDLEKQVIAKNKELEEEGMPDSTRAGIEEEVKTLKAKQDIINQDLLRRGSDEALTRVGAAAAKAEETAPTDWSRFEQSMKKANAKADATVAARVQQKENAKKKRQSYLDLETSLGGTIRELNLTREQKEALKRQLRR